MKMLKKKDQIKAKSNRLETVKHIGILKKAEGIADSVLAKLESIQDVKAAEYARQTNLLKQQLSSGATLDDILVDAFALAHKAIKEIYGISLYKVQIMGGYALHRGDVAEMKTGEGKTLTAILPAYLNALSGQGVHIITVNDYLATRDAFNTGKVFKLLGLTTGTINSELSPEEKRASYAKDITYMTNSELGFDYLKDNMVKRRADKVQRTFNYAIVDEVDSVLIDEARTPLIISGGSFVQEEEYVQADMFVKTLKPEDYAIDKETRQSYLEESGIVKAEQHFNLKKLYSNENAIIVHRIANSLQANFIFKFDVDYTIKDDEIVLIDIFTGRLLEGRQFSEGLNQAIEAKEGVKIKPETKTLASITYQNLFRMYKRLSGMSGTAIPEEEEFLQVYNMRVLPIPTNTGLAREDHPDLIFATKKIKLAAVVKEIKRIHKTGQPLLVGTRAVVDSEELAELLYKEDIEVEVLNAKNHAREAEIILRAGEKNSITISTNMAGRGTDIKLGDGVIELGGLYVLGTERHESRRIDDQLRGRSGRQGDIGHSRFFVSLEDEIIIRAGMNRLGKFMKSLDSEPIESRMVTRSLNVAQKRIEGTNYDQRKSVIEYDDVQNSHRTIVYKQRDNILETKSYEALLKDMISKTITIWSLEDDNFENGNFAPENFLVLVRERYNLTEETLPSKELTQESTIEYVKHKIFEYIEVKFKDLENRLEFKTNDYMRDVMVYALDTSWTDHLDRLSKLKSGIRYRQYAQKNPVQVYVFESKDLFENFKHTFMDKATTLILGVDPDRNTNAVKKERETRDLVVN